MFVVENPAELKKQLEEKEKEKEEEEEEEEEKEEAAIFIDK